jgi:hypothetical protein
VVHASHPPKQGVPDVTVCTPTRHGTVAERLDKLIVGRVRPGLPEDAVVVLAAAAITGGQDFVEFGHVLESHLIVRALAWLTLVAEACLVAVPGAHLFASHTPIGDFCVDLAGITILNAAHRLARTTIRIAAATFDVFKAIIIRIVQIVIGRYWMHERTVAEHISLGQE